MPQQGAASRNPLVKSCTANGVSHGRSDRAASKLPPATQRATSGAARFAAAALPVSPPTQQAAASQLARPAAAPHAAAARCHAVQPQSPQAAVAQQRAMASTQQRLELQSKAAQGLWTRLMHWPDRRRQRQTSRGHAACQSCYCSCAGACCQWGGRDGGGTGGSHS